MKKFILISAVLCFTSCVKKIKLEKPFIITDKNTTYSKGNAIYEYTDYNGYSIEFSDTPTAYKIGDTIK